ncbi:MAG: hypothetical protein ACREN8_01535 [Candidatus Dormibacteraceae bacterium]
MASDSRKDVRDETPDLQTQLEAIFDAVWQSEAEWRLDDRIDLSLSLERKHPKMLEGEHPKPPQPA